MEALVLLYWAAVCISALVMAVLVLLVGLIALAGAMLWPHLKKRRKWFWK